MSTVACDAGISFEDYRNPRHDLSEMIYAIYEPSGPPSSALAARALDRDVTARGSSAF